MIATKQAQLMGNMRAKMEEKHHTDITTLYQSKVAAISRYLEAEQVDRNTPYHDSRHSSRQTVEAHWNALCAITEYKQAMYQHQMQWLFLHALCALCQESEEAA